MGVGGLLERAGPPAVVGREQGRAGLPPSNPPGSRAAWGEDQGMAGRRGARTRVLARGLQWSGHGAMRSALGSWRRRPQDRRGDAARCGGPGALAAVRARPRRETAWGVDGRRRALPCKGGRRRVGGGWGRVKCGRDVGRLDLARGKETFRVSTLTWARPKLQAGYANICAGAQCKLRAMWGPFIFSVRQSDVVHSFSVR